MSGLNGKEPPIPGAEELLIITGSMGSGKSTVLGEASDLLRLQGIPHAAIDLDPLGIFHLPVEVNGSGVALRNLQYVWENYAALGLKRLLLASAIETRMALESCRQAVAAKRTVMCRLLVSLATMQRRVRLREPGVFQQSFVDRVAELEDMLDRAQLEDFSIANEDGSVTEVAREMLVRAGWLST
jgi:hypothetical protein